MVRPRRAIRGKRAAKVGEREGRDLIDDAELGDRIVERLQSRIELREQRGLVVQKTSVMIEARAEIHEEYLPIGAQICPGLDDVCYLFQPVTDLSVGKGSSDATAQERLSERVTLV